MRIEQELLVEDTERIGSGDTTFRTSEQRRSDALVALVLRIAEAREMGSQGREAPPLTG